MTSKDITDRLSQLSQGLLFPSESKYPLVPFIWESATFIPENILTRSQKPSDTPIEVIALENFFAPIVTDEDCFEDEGFAICK
jgi:hypothetical protein